MTSQIYKTDFIVDQFGNVEDVRQRKAEGESSKDKYAASPAPRSPVKNPSFPKKFKPYLYLVPIIVITIVLILIFSYSNKKKQTTTTNAHDFFITGEKFFDNKEYDKAINSYTQAIQLEPEFGQAYNNRGLAHHVLGNYDDALTDFNVAIKILPNSAEVYSNRGLAYLYKGDYEKAILDFEQSIQLRPNFSNAFYNRGLAYFNTGNYDQAVADFTNAIKLTPNLGSSINQGNENGDDATNSRVVNNLKAIQFGENDVAMAYTNRGCAYLYKGDFDKAILDIDKAVELQPDLSLAYYDRAGVYYSMGLYDKAIADYKKVVELDNDRSVKKEAEAWLIELGEK
jgi:tetratricopeptide (TPR) repeat protein